MEQRSRSQAYDLNSVAVLLGLVAVTALSVLEPGHATRTGAVVAALLAARGLWVGKRLSAPDWAAVAVVGVASLAYLFLAHGEYALLLYVDLVALALVYVAFRLSIDRPLYLWAVVATFVGACVFMTFNMIDSFSPEGILIPDRHTYGRLNSNFFAYCMAAAVFLLCAAVQALVRARHRAYATVVALVAGFPVVGMVSAGGRGALLAASAAVAALVALPLLARIRLWLWLTGLAVASVAWAGGLLDAVVAGLLGSDDREDGTLNGRLTMWPQARREIADSPLLGQGVGASMDDGVANHNVLLDLGVDLGLLGIVAWAVWVGVSLRAGTDGERRLTYWVVGASALLLPILATGYWHVTAAVWIILALVSRQGVVADGPYVRGWLTPRSAVAAATQDVVRGASALRGSRSSS